MTYPAVPARLCSALLVMLVMAPLAATAQVAPGSITFEPSAPSSIPTLGGLTLLVLAAALGALGLFALGRRGRTTPLALLGAALLLGALAAGQVGVRMQPAVAGLDCFDITDPGGETFDVVPRELNEYCNASGVTMTVAELELPEFQCETPFDVPGTACELGTQIQNGQSCAIECTFVADSDLRLKTDIERVGRTVHGLALYEYRYIDRPGRYRGVMAQDVLEVRPDAVVEQPDGYLRVDYAELGISLQRLD
jgi:hypothetical protein